MNRSLPTFILSLMIGGIPLFFHSPSSYAAENNIISHSQPSNVLTPKHLYANALRELPEWENEREINYKQAIQAKLKNNIEEAKIYYQKSARVDSAVAMSQLAELDLPNKLDWAILSFQVHWIKTGDYLKSPYEIIKRLAEKENNNSAKTFLEELESCYPKKGNSFKNFNQLARKYINKTTEPYLTQNEGRGKAVRFLAAINNKEGYMPIARMFLNGALDTHFSSEEKTKYILKYADLSNDSVIFCDTGYFLERASLNDLNTLKLAEQYYHKSQSCRSYLQLGMMWFHGRLGEKQRYKISIEYLLKSKLPRAYYHAAAIYQSGLEKGNFSQQNRDKEIVRLLETSLSFKAEEVKHSIKTFLPNQDKEAIYHLETSVAFAHSQYLLGLMYYKNEGVSSDLTEEERDKKAKQLLTQAAENNVPSALYYLGKMYREKRAGNDISEIEGSRLAIQSLQEAVKLSEHNQSIPPQEKEKYKLELARTIIDSGEGQQEESNRYQKAFDLIAECKSNTAKVIAGRLILFKNVNVDWSLKQKYERAKQYFEEANIPESLYLLGRMYYSGEIDEGPNKIDHLKKSNELFKKSNTSMANEMRANLLYENPEVESGLTGKKRDQEIFKLFQNSGTSEGKAGMGIMYMQGRVNDNLSQEERDQKAKYLFEEAHTSGAYNNLGILYCEGRVEKDLSLKDRLNKGIEYLEKANSVGSFINLAIIYSQEDPVKDYDQSIYYFHLALASGYNEAAKFVKMLLQEKESSSLSKESLSCEKEQPLSASVNG